MKLNQWALIAIGAWILLSPWILGIYEINFAVWSSLFSGCAIILIALWNALPSEKE